MSDIKRWMVDDDFSSMPRNGSYRVFMKHGKGVKRQTAYISLSFRIYPGHKGSYTAEQAVWALKKIYETQTKNRFAQYIEKV